MRASPEFSIDLTAEELLSSQPYSPANVARRPTAHAAGDTVEIELTAEEMDALLTAGSPPARG
jgi:hypothetical protein